MPSRITLSPLLRQIKKINQFRTAQLHIHRYLSKFRPSGAERTPGFRTEGILHFLSRFVSESTGKAVSASLTVEAALVLPLFVVSICFLMMPIVILNAQAEAQYEMEKAAELASGGECLKKMFSSSDKETTGGTTNETTNGAANGTTGETTNGTTDKATDGKLEEYLKSSPAFVATAAYIESVYPKDILGEPIPTAWEMATETDPMIRLRVISWTKFPLSSFLNNNWGFMGLITYRRAWVGREGGAGRTYEQQNAGEAGETEEAEDRIVYVARKAKTSKRYHVSPSCHYISNKMTAVSVSALSSMRSDDGSKYYACSACKPSSTGTVYIFPSSNLYHASTNCKAIQAFVEEMKESEAQKKGYSPCSYCGKK